MARSRSKLHVAALAGTPDEVEALFYEAMHIGNLERLMSVWADEDEIACIHPGGQRLRGAGAIRNSFESMFADGGSIQVVIAEVHRVESLTSAVHHVVERIEMSTPNGPVHTFVLATNVYHKTAQGWRLVLHHASPGAYAESDAYGDNPMVIH